MCCFLFGFLFILLFSFNLLFADSNGVMDQTSTTVPDSTALPNNMPNLYVHAFGGAGFSYLSSDDITSLLGDEFGIGIGLPTWSYGIRGGFKNIIQLEYNIGIADHNFNNNSIIPDIPSEVIKMDYKTKDVQIKINPFFWRKTDTSARRITSWFLVAGKGDVEWFDTEGDGFTGTSTIYGIEYALLSKYVSGSFSFKRYGIQFDETKLFGFTFKENSGASDYIMEVKIGFGFGN
jgi:hypothetical protein